MLCRDSEDVIKICVWTSDMTSRSYFGKMNSTLGSVVPLAMFWYETHLCLYLPPSLTYVLMWWKVFGLPAYISHLPRKCKLPKVVIQLQCLIIATTRGAAASSGRTAREHRAAREEGSLWWGALYRHHSSVGRVVIWGTSIGKTCHPCRKGVEILLKLSLGKKPKGPRPCTHTNLKKYYHSWY